MFVAIFMQPILKPLVPDIGIICSRSGNTNNITPVSGTPNERTLISTFRYTGKRSWLPSPLHSRVRVVLPHGTTHSSAEALLQVYRQLEGHTDILAEYINTTEVFERKHRTHKACSVLEESPERNTYEIIYHSIYYNNTKILYCTVPKAGSKFLKTFFSALDDELPSIGTILHERTGTRVSKLVQYKNTEERQAYMWQIMKGSFKVVFSRDPYSRIFSFYVDKLLTPNEVFLSLAKNISGVTRNESNKCRYSVEFHELISYLLTITPAEYNKHFRPVSKLCDVCSIEYDFLAKVETFKHDLQYILNVTKTNDKITYRSFEEESDIEYLVFRTRRTFKHLMIGGIYFPISTHVTYLRLWRGFQIEGLIDITEDYPLDVEESDKATLTLLCNLVLDANYRSSGNATANKQAALVQAYSQVSLEDMEKLRRVFMDDFKLFQYEDRPDILFDRTSEATTKQFDFFDVLHI